MVKIFSKDSVIYAFDIQPSYVNLGFDIQISPHLSLLISLYLLTN